MFRKIKRKTAGSRLGKRIRRTIALKRLQTLSPGSTAWLVETEVKYGGFVTGVIMNRQSRHDPREYSRPRRMQGGDRMRHHGYAEKYSQYMKPYLTAGERMVLLEIGILRGTGLAVWSDLFAKARVIGLDIDLTHTRNNLANLREMGAFKERDVELYEFDQFESTSSYLGDILKSDRLDICIDDADHGRDAILRTMETVMRYMKDEFVYFIEDNSAIYEEICAVYPEYEIERCGRLIIVSHMTSP